ncbi:MAG: hypothetical protein ABJQ14_13155, partial [Hyphomicrobiales bacterium]
HNVGGSLLNIFIAPALITFSKYRRQPSGRRSKTVGQVLNNFKSVLSEETVELTNTMTCSRR